ncbi:MAG: methylcrotonoyl-CoA carboxylase [Acidimicrobiaceae bacterium]|nr:methylcrotonoyl-CoA carboxylase [Acidimicrobiaceae bacterium]
MRILIANRGEIARRVIRSAKRLGHETIAVYADPDATAPFVADADHAVRIGPASLAESYLSSEQLLAACAETGADAVHPGYGFLSENADFAQAVLDAGLVWIGPKPEAIATMGSKIEARRLAAEARVPIIPGFSDSQEPDDLAAAAERIGYPVLVKAAAGGGGKGIRIAETPAHFAQALNEAVTEATRSFGDGRVIVERYILRPRHVEVQVVGDKHGTVIELGTRECSVQRRYQKLVEEAPAPNLPDSTETGLRTAAVRLAESIGYDSTGTVEFVVDDETGDYFFLEMNTRLQVEHPVTEAITGLDLVELQIRAATSLPLGVAQDSVAFSGHAIEVRINTEDATNDFAPQIGRVTVLDVPDSIRWDSAIENGSTITPHYDPMIAKLIVHALTREATIARLRAGLDRLLLGGVVTNGGFHRWLIDRPEFRAGRITTRFLDETELPVDYGVLEAAAVAAYRAPGSGPWGAGDRRFTPHRPSRTVAMRDLHGNVHEVEPVAGTAIDGVVNVRGQSHTFSRLSRSEHWAPDSAGSHGAANAVVAPFPAVVAEVHVEPGQVVDGTDPTVVIEAMKTLHTLTAGGPGVVAEVRIAPGDHVDTNQILITFEHPEETEDA